MAKNLVIVESPAKAKTIEKFLGPDYKVLSCYGHVRDLPKSQTSIDISNGYTPQYEIPNEKKKVVAELMKEAHGAECVWLASDEDREGEAIAWHLAEVLKLDPNRTKRIVFNEITKTAILKAIESPRQINLDLANAQQARRVLDRLVGYEISPVLWKKVRPQLSAGRVQSVAVRLIVERENEIQTFASQSNFKVVASFVSENHKQTPFEAELHTRFESQDLAQTFLMNAHGANYKVAAIDVRPTKRSPAAPFTTSTLQQEASRKLNFSVSKTMMVAQQLYEAGLITYMRTDSVHLSETALGMAKDVIEKNYGTEYYKRRQYATKTKGAQEAHEAIRPAYMERSECEGLDNQQRRLYELIWKRTVASQMSDAEFSKTQVDIEISTRKEHFIAKGLVMTFNGFIKLYSEDREDDDSSENKKVLPALSEKEALSYKSMKATQSFSSAPPRYSEASLVKKMEELGIGRPSTYAPTISTIQKREYVVKENREGQERSYCILELKSNGSVIEKTLVEKYGSEKGKLFPTDVGSLVNQFLEAHFESIVDYNFTAEVEKEFDDVATGQQSWNNMIDRFYKPFHTQVAKTEKESEKVSGVRLLGVDPKTAKNIYVKLGRFGAVAQLGETSDEIKPTFAGLKKGQSINTITLEEAIDLFKLPRTVGEFEGAEMVVAIGRFGPYVRHNTQFYPIPKTEDPFTVSHESLIQIIQDRRVADAQKLIKVFDENPDLKVLNGRFGPYISFEKKNYKIPKSTDPSSLTYQNCLDLIEQAGQAPAKKVRKK